MATTEALITHPWYGYPYAGNPRRHTPHILAVVHQTAVVGYDGQAMALRNQRNTATKPGNTSTYYVDPDGDAVHAVDGTKFASWGSCPDDYLHWDHNNSGVAIMSNHTAKGFNPNECVWEQIEGCGSGNEPWTDAIFESAAHIIANRSLLSHIPISRTTVLAHRDLDLDDRPSDPWPSDRREARMTRLIERAKAIAGEADMLGVVTRTPFPDGQRVWHVAAGTTLNGYDPKQPGKVVKSVTWTTSSWAHASAEANVAWPDTTTPPVPSGGPFLEVADGSYAGLLIVKALVTLDPPPPPPVDETPFDQTYVNDQVTKAVLADRQKAHIVWS